MNLNELKNKVARTTDPKPKLRKPTRGHQSKGGLEGQLVGEGDVVQGNFAPTPQQKEIARNEMKDVNQAIAMLLDRLEEAKEITKSLPSQISFPVELEELIKECQLGIQTINHMIDGVLREAVQVYMVYKDGSPISKHASKKDADQTAAMLSVPGSSSKIEVRGPVDDPQQAKKEKDKFNYVGHTKEAEEPTADKSARHKLDHSLRAQGHKVEKDKKKKLKKGEVKHKGKLYDDLIALEDKKKTKKDACYHKVKSRYKVWPSAYASGALVQCRKKGAANWGNSKKK